MKVGIIGAGTMGSGIAQAFAQTEGYEVCLCDINDELAANGVPATALTDHDDAHATRPGLAPADGALQPNDAAANDSSPSPDVSGAAGGTGLAPADGALEVQPGVDPLDANLRRVAAHPMPADGGFAFTHDGGDFTAAVHRCTGVGKCRAGVSGTFMCPSYLATRDEKDVTRGRARILQEAANSQLVKAIDSPEVLEALDLCLACKACSADCPAGVDMARYRSEALFRTYRGRMRPLSTTRSAGCRASPASPRVCPAWHASRTSSCRSLPCARSPSASSASILAEACPPSSPAPSPRGLAATRCWRILFRLATQHLLSLRLPALRLPLPRPPQPRVPQPQVPQPRPMPANAAVPRPRLAPPASATVPRPRQPRPRLAPPASATVSQPRQPRPRR